MNALLAEQGEVLDDQQPRCVIAPPAAAGDRIGGVVARAVPSFVRRGLAQNRRKAHERLIERRAKLARAGRWSFRAFSRDEELPPRAMERSASESEDEEAPAELAERYRACLGQTITETYEGYGDQEFLGTVHDCTQDEEFGVVFTVLFEDKSQESGFDEQQYTYQQLRRKLPRAQ